MTFADAIKEWLIQQQWYDYLNWLLAQPTSESSGLYLVIGVIIVAIILIVALR